ncbi:hypothetical protein B0J18DRAFT_62763 [Chaetomium sp. MPI-SDFR-AT-0129]|nr:hypothetical protein B0J18DRAFT_62763 [Chaetomium sp. MPI-SDFR-AT-0129]
MFSSRPATSLPPSDDIFSHSPPPAFPPQAPTTYAAPGSRTSPSPRSRRRPPSRGRTDPTNTILASRSLFGLDDGYNAQQANTTNRDIGRNSPADSGHRPSIPAFHRATPSASIIPSNPPRSSSLATSNPPRTSSLLPAARITADPGAPYGVGAPELRDPFNDPRPAPRIPDLTRGDSRQRRGHSRSSSTGGLSDTFRNLNRWSASTASSRASNLADFTRRVSADILGVAFHSPGRRLHRRQPSTPGGSPRSSVQNRSRAESPSAPAVPPLQRLPHISTGPSLEHEVLEAELLGRLSPEQTGNDQRRAPNGNTLEVGDDRPGPAQESGSLSSFYGAHIGAQAHDDPGQRPSMPYTQNGQAGGHSRSRSTGANGSADTTTSSRSRERDRDSRERDRQGRPLSQKAMLSKALQKANTAVQLDNAQNFEGARRAYSEACAVLHQVLLRTSGEEDRRKLEAIHETYLGRVMELDEQLVDMEPEGKALPLRPESNDLEMLRGEEFDDDYSRPFTATGTGISTRTPYQDNDHDTQPNTYLPEPTRPPPPPSRASPIPGDGTREGPSSYLTQQYSLQSAFSRARYNGSNLRPPTMDGAYVPPPLSPRRAFSPTEFSPQQIEHGIPHRPPPQPPAPSNQLAPQAPAGGHRRINSHESVSWLNPIDESEHSSVTSVHSRSSSRVRRRQIRAASGATEAEFDAALDDAIEAAYDDGYEPESHVGRQPYGDPQTDPIANTLRRVEMARELVRESEREALELANEREQRLRLQQQLEDEEYRRQNEGEEGPGEDNDSEEEERLLEEMGLGNAIEDFAFGAQPTQAVPRESDSSGMTGRTWHSSTGSNPPTATTVLTPVSEDNNLPRPSGPLPALPPHAAAPLPPQPTSAGSQTSSQSVRNRRLSGQNPKELKIETNKLAPAAPATAGPAIPSQPKAGSYIVQQRQALSAGSNRIAGPFSARAGPSPIPGTLDEEPDEPLPPMAFSHEEYPRVGTPSVVRAPNLRKNFSASSLKSLKTRNLSISHLDETSDHSPATPVSNHFGSRLPAVPSLPPGFVGKDRANSTTTSGLHLFENHFHSADEPGSPNPLTLDAPAPLEPCPNEFMLRPFWLMRALYQTLCHPRGGYISNKLFVPRDVWGVKGVKLKGLEDKIANCDLLTAALQRLGCVDTCDADAVLEEMQALEGVLEQVQATLTRKLGNEVGVQAASSMFKDAGAADAAADAASMPRSASVAGKASTFSWRRLRSKNSSANLPGLTHGGRGAAGGLAGAGLSSTNLADGAAKDMALASLPMTMNPTSRPTKRDIGSVSFAGPNANYMASLARLFDAAQTVDQIARQVDDPGLRHADKTQVGLELCTRHAAEFFAFYVCRFALSDLTMLLDKFVKRGTEWVLA